MRIIHLQFTKNDVIF